MDNDQISGGLKQWTEDQMSNFSFLSGQKFSVSQVSEKGDILCFLLELLLFGISSHCIMILELQGHLNHLKVTEISAHKKPTYSQISTSARVWRVV